MINQEFFYIIKIAGVPNVKKIYIEIITYVGDVEIYKYFYNANDISVSQYTSINKINLSIKINDNSESLNDLTFSVKSKTNSFYSVLSTFVYEDIDDSLITNEIPTGFSYLITIDPKIINEYKKENKLIIFKNERINEYNPIMVLFYSLNCKIEVEQVYKDIDDIIVYKETKRYEQFSYDLIEPNNNDVFKVYSEKLEYRINIIENIPSEDDEKLCIIYSSAIEVSDNHEENIKDIIIPNNITQQIMFGKDFKHISYGYVHMDYQKDLIINFSLKNKAQYRIKLYYENEKREKEEIIKANDILYLNSSEWFNICRYKEGCYIQLDITLEKDKDFDNPVLELSIQMVENTLFLSN